MKRFNVLVVAVVLVIACAVPQEAHGRDPSKTIFGYVERVIIADKGFSLKGKLDTGAETSSLDAHNITRFRRGDTRYVRFDVRDPDSDEFITLERPLARNVRIKQHDGPSTRRPVVNMWICLGHLTREVEVSLVPREGFIYPLLIGRSAMRGSVIVDPELTFTSRPKCDPARFIE
ncbi:MAG: ATP-dependent zinc protease [Gammaproteobacteria bacterium]